MPKPSRAAAQPRSRAQRRKPEIPAVVQVAAGGVRDAQAVRQRGRLAAAPGGGGVNDQVEGLAAELRQAAGLGAGEARRQFMGAGGGAVGEQQPGGPRVEQLAQDAGGGAARAQQQHAPAGRGEAGGFEVAQQARAVGVVGAHRAVRERQPVGRARAAGARARRVRQRQRRGLVRQGHVEAAPAGRGEAAHGGRELPGRRVQLAVLEVDAGGGGEVRVQHRRQAVRDRVPDDAVAVHGIIRPATRPPSRPRSSAPRRRRRA